jgi:hypothetical protein
MTVLRRGVLVPLLWVAYIEQLEGSSGFSGVGKHQPTHASR